MKNTLFDLYYTGLKNKGFNNIYINEISVDTYGQYKLLMSRSNFNYFNECYELNEKKQVYELQEYDEVELGKLMKRVLPFHYLLYKEELAKNNFKSEAILGMQDYTTVYKKLESLSEDQRTFTLLRSKKELKKYNDKELNELIYKEIQLEYNKIGHKINNIQMKYIKLNFAKITIYVALFLILGLLMKIIRKGNYVIIQKSDYITNWTLLMISLLLLYTIYSKYTTIICGIYLFAFSLISILKIIRKNSKTNNTFLEKKLNFKLFLERIYNFKAFYLILLYFIINIIIYIRYKGNYIFTELTEETVYSNIIYFSTLIYSIFLVLSIIILENIYKKEIVNNNLQIDNELITENNEITENVMGSVEKKKKKKKKKNVVRKKKLVKKKKKKK